MRSSYASHQNMETVLLGLVAFLAGFIDAIVGGGGLIQVPGLLAILPKTSEVLLLGTNKLVSATGTAVATYRYAVRIPIPWRAVLPAMVLAFLFSIAGARTVSIISPAVLRPIILALLFCLAIYVCFNPSFGSTTKPNLSQKQELWIGVLAGSVIGFYDGFFGPGTGIFLMFLFIKIFGYDFLTASAAAKAINLATNIAAILYFAWIQAIWYSLAMPMIVCNMLGAVLGTKLAILKGNRLIRWLFIMVVFLMIAKIAFDMLKPA